MAQAGLIDAIAATGTDAQADGTAPNKPNVPDTEDAIRADPRLGEEQKAALIAVYRSMLAAPPRPDYQPEPPKRPARPNPEPRPLR